MINLNDFAKAIAGEEGLKENLNIAQIKEVLRIVLRFLKELPVKDLVALLTRIK